MSNGLNLIICATTVTIIMIAEKGMPVKLNKKDNVVYFILFWFLVFVSKEF